MPLNVQQLLLAEGAAAGGGFTATTFDTGTLSNTSLSNGNLTATHSNTSVGGARSTSYKSSGKYYFEVTVGATHGLTDAIAVMASTYSYANLAGNSGICVCWWPNNGGSIISGGGNTFLNIGAGSPGDVIGIAVDIGAAKTWWRRNGGLWNGSGTANPATGANAASFSSGSVTVAPAIGFTGSGQQSGDNFTANFGATSFSGTVPSGFTAGWAQ